MKRPVNRYLSVFQWINMDFRRCMPLLIILAVCSSAQEWPMFQHDPAHTGSVDSASNLDLSDIEVLWVYRTDDRLYYSPVAGDLNGDGRLEVVFTTLEGMVYALDIGGELVWSYDLGKPLVSSPAIGNLSGGRFVAFVSRDGEVILLDGNGRVLQVYDTGLELYSTSVAVGDVNDDGAMDIVFNSVVLDSNGGLMDYDIESLAGRGYAGDYTAVADADADGVYETYWGQPPKMPVVADLDGDGSLEVVKAVDDKKRQTTDILVFNWSQELMESVEAEGISSPPVAADLDGDGKKEIVFCDDAGWLNIINVNDWDVDTQKVMDSKCIYIIPADLNGDGTIELLMASSEGQIYALGSLRDSDGDGLPDYTEDVIGTDKLSQDTDGDGLDDMRDEEPKTPREIEVVEDRPAGNGVELFTAVVALLAAAIIVVAGPIAVKWARRARGSMSRRGGLRGAVKRFGRKVDIGESDGSFFDGRRGSKVDVEREWTEVTDSDFVDIEDGFARKLTDLVASGSILTEDAAARLKTSKIKLAKYAMMLEKEGYVRIDSSRGGNNPLLRPTIKLRRGRT